MRLLDACRAVLRGYRGEKIGLRAAALTYFTIFSLVPLLTVVLVTLESFHQRAIEDQVHSYISDILAPGIQKDSAVVIEHLLASASSLALKGIGFLTLAVSAGSLLKNLDESLNDLWNVSTQRTWGVRLLRYAFALLVGPLLLAISLAGTAGARQLLLGAGWASPGVIAFGVPTLATALGLSALYMLVPNTKVEGGPALAAALVATIGWELVKHAYAAFAAGIFRYNVLYGSLGAVPLFLLWCYVSWALVLFGARLAFALQHGGALERLSHLRAHPRGEELLALGLAQALAQAELEGIRPVPVRELAKRANVPEHALPPLLRRFVQAELIHLAHGRVTLVRDPRSLHVDELRRLILPDEVAHLPDRLAELARALDGELQGVTWAELASPTSPEPTQKPSAHTVPVQPLRKA